MDQALDAKGVACSMSIIKTKKAMDNLKTDKILEVKSTDKGTKSDLKA